MTIIDYSHLQDDLDEIKAMYERVKRIMEGDNWSGTYYLVHDVMPTLRKVFEDEDE